MSTPSEVKMSYREAVRQHIARLRASYRNGDQGELGLSFAKALKAAVAMEDRLAEVFLCRCAGLVFSPRIALEWLSRARLLAKSYGIEDEKVPALANLGVVNLELGDFETARACLTKSLASLEGAARAVTLSNLALIVSRHDRAQAKRLLASAIACAAPCHWPAILSNQLALEAEEAPLRPPDFAGLVTSAAEACAAPLFDVVLFNHIRSLLEAGQAERALKEVEARDPKEKEFRDGALGLGRWARLRLEILKDLGVPVPPDVAAQAAVLARSAEPQVWLYRTGYALCPIVLDFRFERGTK